MITSNNGLMMGIIIAIIIAAAFFHIFLMSHWSKDYHHSLLDSQYRYKAGGSSPATASYEYFCGNKCHDM